MGELVTPDESACRQTLTVKGPIAVRLDVVLEIVNGLLFGHRVAQYVWATLAPRLPAVHLDATASVDAVFALFLLRVDHQWHSISPHVRG